MNQNNDSNQVPGGLEQFIRDETIRLQKETRRTWIIGGILAVILIIYMSFILSMIRQATDPDFVANYIASEVETRVPAIINDAENSLKYNAPVFADGISKMFMDTVPKLRATAEEQIDYCHKEMIPHLSKEFQDIIRTYVLENGQELRDLAATSGSPEAADAFVESMFDELYAQLEKNMPLEFEGRDIAYFKNNALYALEAIDAHLAKLAVDDPSKLDHRMQLQRKLIANLVRRLTDYKAFDALPQPKLPVIEVPDASDFKPETYEGRKL